MRNNRSIYISNRFAILSQNREKNNRTEPNNKIFSAENFMSNQYI
jgi:hypothetical protein